MCATCAIGHADAITLIFFKNSHKAPPKSLGHLRLREQRRQPLQKFAQKAPQPPALKPPSTARTAGRSDWAERRFRRQPFILLSFSSSEKLRKAQETQSYQHIQCIGHTDFNTSGTNGPRSLSPVKVGTHSPLLKGSHTAVHTAKHGPSLPRPQHGLVLPAKSPPKEQPEEADARLWRVSASSGVAAPLGCVIFFAFVEIGICTSGAQGLSVCARRGVVSLPSARFTCC